MTRTFKNDTQRWVLGQMETQEECSAVAGRPLCRTLTRTHTLYGEVETEAVDSDECIPDTKLFVRYGRDDFGNVESVTAVDAFEHRRGAITTYEPEGIFPETEENAEGHTTGLEFDPGLGVLIRETDPNGRVTEWKHDGFGRLGRVIRPEGSQTT